MTVLRDIGIDRSEINRAVREHGHADVCRNDRLDCIVDTATRNLLR